MYIVDNNLPFWERIHPKVFQTIMCDYDSKRFCLSHQPRQPIGVVAEWLSRKTRNLVPSGASVRIWPTSFFLGVGGRDHLPLLLELRGIFLFGVCGWNGMAGLEIR